MGQEIGFPENRRLHDNKPNVNQSALPLCSASLLLLPSERYCSVPAWWEHSIESLVGALCLEPGRSTLSWPGGSTLFT